ncbi:MAG: hypothetical protein ACP5N2_06930 [Candidatus Nanoarchaeia archaeon]
MNFLNKNTKGMLGNNSKAINMKTNLLERNRMIKELNISIIALANKTKQYTFRLDENITKSVVDEANMKLHKEALDKLLSDMKKELKNIRNTVKEI